MQMLVDVSPHPRLLISSTEHVKVSVPGALILNAIRRDFGFSTISYVAQKFCLNVELFEHSAQ